MRELDPDESNLLLDEQLSIRDVIEQGPFSNVYRILHGPSNRKFLLRSINLNLFRQHTGLGFEEIDEEIRICQNLQHPYICRLEKTINSVHYRHIIFENMEGNDICFEIVQRASNGFVFSEYVVSHYTRQLLDALDYCHTRKIVHRDVRPHNLVLASKDTSAPLKLCGFGVAKDLSEIGGSMACGRVGVPQFMAPEIVRKDRVSCSSDIWSSGVVLFLLLAGRLPFSGSTSDIYERIMQTDVDVDGYMPNISESARNLVRRMLNADPSKRISAKEALNHEWIRDKEHMASRKHMNDVIDQMRRYNESRKLKSNVLSAVNSGRFDETTPRQDTPQTAFVDGSSPGGDCCHRGESSSNDAAEPPADKDLSGAYKVLGSLDAINSLLDPNSYKPGSTTFQKIHDDGSVRNLLRLYDKIKALPCEPVVTEVDTSTLRKETLNQIDGLLGPSPEALELRQLLNSPHLASCVQALDVVVCEIRDPKNEASGSGDKEGNCVSSDPAPAYLNGGVLPLGAQRAGTSFEHFNQSAVHTSYDEEEEELYDCMSRLRLVQFQKDTQEPMGITLKVNEDGRCFVARIMHGGMIHRQATLHVGDEIREINGMSVANRSVESLQEMLRDARGQVTFKIIPSYRSAPPACEIFVRAQFDYEPSQDDLIPCPQAGIPFKTGDILQVISKDDHNWWQARFVSSFPSIGNSSNAQRSNQQQVAGLIPSPELQEWRTACLAMERSKNTCNTHCMWFNKKKKYYTTKYLQKHSALFDQLDLVTYEEVMRLSQYRRKTLVLLGAHGVGRRHIKNTLIHRHPNRFAYPIPHTTRPPRKDEVDGKHYYFVTNEQMMADIQNNEYLEYGTHEESMYGTKLETIRNIHKSGKIAILDVEPQALKVLRTAEYSPFVVFIAAPNLQGMQDPDGSLEKLLNESDVLRQAFGHLFDFIITNSDIDDTIAQLERLVEKLPAYPQWLPVTWVY
ncbi:Protein lin-2 [Caenorhabditis elegans]|uniref:Protein lin-2 n=1 Tax=Caenorhabditis elegans TaxID=6239 RepID=LIN2_CAEEL|nr:Protein lin-2 [Caenorhabditis elegans]P54936.1 RecName: Full=Protein lin-2; AltName: Full=Abnormal cell lineage protein 2 [Caenorhabditis elegans]CAA63314.1 LIN-2A [Caenorhabditis elegans]CAA90760.2 Protein lin-2 [Caenorhabditis elegans]|eukprot:NP_001024587.1 Protein lin-2 [Caenorhabditis elegans]